MPATTESFLPVDEHGNVSETLAVPSGDENPAADAVSLGADIVGPADESTGDAASTGPADPKAAPHAKWLRRVAFGLLPALALLLAAAAGYLKWQDSVARSSETAGIEAVAVAKDTTMAMLSYQADTVEKDLVAASERLTGKFKDSYSQLIHDVVIPGATKEHISAVATVPAAALVSATPGHAVVLVYVDQTVVVGTGAPTETASALRVTLDRQDSGWFISDFAPV